MTPIRKGSIYAVGEAFINVDGSLCATSFRMKKTPHWQRYGEGVATLELSGAILGQGPSDEAKARCWLQMDTSESGEKSSKRTMICLHGPKEIERLRDLCNLLLGQ